MKVKDLLRTRTPLTVRPDDELALARQMMLWGNVRHLPVVNHAGAVVGIVTEHDILRYRATGGTDDRDPVQTFMTHPVEVIDPEASVAEASARMLARRIGCLPVLENGRLVGILTTTDLLGSQVVAGPPRASSAGPPIATIMRRAVATVTAEQPFLEAVGIMVDRDVRHVPVLDGAGRVVGILSDRDVRTAVGDPLDALRHELDEVELLTVGSVMTAPVITVRQEAPLSVVAQRFIDDRIGAIPVVDADDRLVGIVSYVDIIRALREAAA
ncbi:MAG: CBS domain-containing protein [Myxococcales bacterium]|nr:CBS domain-containing protein [Myxococcota bacterium]MDW8281720.1 CBS domain-containing protein [Myxococcales bacterium]